MSQGKGPGRVIDGPNASWGTDDDICQFALTNNSTIKLGQVVCLDVTQYGPDNNVPNNASALPLCERVVATTSGNAGDVFGVVTNITNAPSSGFARTIVQGVPTWTNTTGSTIILDLLVRQQGWGYVYAGAVSIASSGSSILVGSRLITSTSQAFAVRGSAAIGATVGLALATVINTTQTVPGAAAAAGVISVLPQSMVGIVPNAIVLIDTLNSGVQEAVSVGSISLPTFSIAVTNAHPAGFKITQTATSEAINSVLISTPGTGVTYASLIAAYINIGA